MLKTLICVMLGGALGATLRLLCMFETLNAMLNILAINALGSILIGYASLALSHEQKLLKAFLTKGVCGGFTTFSTFAILSAGELAKGGAAIALAYAIFSIFLCIASVRIGLFLGGILNLERRILR